MKVTISVIKADVGSLPGHSIAPKELLDVAREALDVAKEDHTLIDYYVTRCGDDIELIMTHNKGAGHKDIHGLAFRTFESITKIAQDLKLYGAGQDLLSHAFSGNLKGMGPGVAEMEFEERKSEPIVICMADKTEPAAYNLPLFKIFADPFNTAGLTIDPTMIDGFRFEVYDVKDQKKTTLETPQEMYELLALIGTTGRYEIKSISKKNGEPAAAVSAEKLNMMAGRYVGKDDPVCIIRGQSGFPAVGEITEGFSFPHLVAGWMRGSHSGPLMPVGQKDANPTRFDGPPRVIALGFQLANGKLVGPVDLFADISFDLTRAKAMEITDYMRRHGPFEPHRLPEGELEYTSLPHVVEKLKDRFKKI